MANDGKNFFDVAKSLSSNPIGVVGLFVVLVYAFASLVFGLSSGISPGERTAFVGFLVGFPVLIFLSFMWLVVKHHNKLYAPSDFANEDNFVALSKKVDSKVSEEVDRRIAELERKHDYEICYLRLTSAKFQKRFDVAIDWADKYLEIERDSEFLTQKAYCCKY